MKPIEVTSTIVDDKIVTLELALITTKAAAKLLAQADMEFAMGRGHNTDAFYQSAERWRRRAEQILNGETPDE